MNNFYGWSMSEYLPTGDFHAIEFTKRNEKLLLKSFLRTPENSDCD